MFRLVPFLILVFLSGICTAGKKGAPKGNFAQFLAGVSILSNNRTLSDEQKALEFSNLMKITGITAKEALQRIESYREKPSEWKKIYTESLSTITDNNKRKAESADGLIKKE
ncbi:MAG: hypothetical protein GX556_02775 [Fibrobacter sp.]|nr:hypothetical protein [Fibrobacter sp.]